MSSDLAIFEHPEVLAQATSFAERIASSELIAKALQKRPNDVLIVLLTGRELGLKPMSALAQIAVVQGKPVLSASLCRSLAVSHPACEYFECTDQTPLIATWKTKRRGGTEQVISFTIDDAKRAGLINKENWQKYPAAMLSARASAILARNAYPDILGGVYIDDERDDIVGEMPRPPKTNSAKSAVMDALAINQPPPSQPFEPLEPLGPPVDFGTTTIKTPIRALQQLSMPGIEYVIKNGIKAGATLKELDEGGLRHYANGTGADAEAAKAELKNRGTEI